MFGMYSYLDGLMARLLWAGSDVVLYGRRQLSHPHRSDRQKRGSRAKARRLAKTRRLRKARG